ncbi:MAG: hypothetical protein QXR63_06285, partial [Candidatus Bathyarchaeia archaeon]
LVKRAEDSLLLPYHMLPQQYFNPSSSTLPIPPRPADQGENLNVSSPPTPSITLARYVNVSIYIQLASYKADYLTLDLKFTYNGTAYEINSTTFKNVTGERWYTYSIDIENVDRSGWWWDPYSRTIPEGSIFTLSFILPPDSATGHIIYSWERYQSLIDLY